MSDLDHRLSKKTERSQSFGESHRLSAVDRAGVWLSGRAVRKAMADRSIRRLMDVGCGHNATLARSLLEQLNHAYLLDVSIAGELVAHRRVSALVGDVMQGITQVPTNDVDIATCLSVLEHLWDPELVVSEMRRITRPGGVCLFNVPNWQGKRALEFSAYRLGLSPAAEIDDHKAYYTKRELWMLLRRGGFGCKEIKVFTHKFGLNTFAVCEVGR